LFVKLNKDASWSLSVSMACDDDVCNGKASEKVSDGLLVDVKMDVADETFEWGMVWDGRCGGEGGWGRGIGARGGGGGGRSARESGWVDAGGNCVGRRRRVEWRRG